MVFQATILYCKDIVGQGQSGLIINFKKHAPGAGLLA